MKTINDVLKDLENIKDNDLEYLYSLIKFKCRNRLEDNNFYNKYLEKIKKQVDLTNSALFILLSQVFSDNGDDGIKKFAFLLAEVAKNYLTKFFDVNNIMIQNLVQNLAYFNFFVLCGEVESEVKQDNDLYINVKWCQFNNNEIFCRFTSIFLEEIFSQIYKDKIIHIDKKSDRDNKICSFIVKVKDFKHIKVLHLE